jgi:hypothetical protein
VSKQNFWYVPTGALRPSAVGYRRACPSSDWNGKSTVRAYRTSATLPRGVLPQRSEHRVEGEGDGTRLPDPGYAPPWVLPLRSEFRLEELGEVSKKNFFFNFD